MAKAAAPKDSVTAYALAVITGQIAAGELVRLSCQRHVDDLQHGGKRGLHFDAKAAEAVIAFVGLLRHSKGQWAGQPFVLEPWQRFVVGCLFGWKRSDGRRRFKVGHLEVARKNGKTTIAAAVGLALEILDNEPGAQIYTLATKRDQARLTHEEAISMAKSSPALAKRVQFFKDAIVVPKINARYLPLCAESGTLDGLNVSGAIADELHAWRDRHLYDVIETATGARRQPLIFITTTAGYDRNGIWWERRELAINVLRGVVPDDTLFAYIATLDKEDDWTDPDVWVKGNPNLGVTIQHEELSEKCEQAKITPGKQPTFRRLRLNQPTESSSNAFDLLRWDACQVPFDPQQLYGRACYVGLDLSSSRDLTAAVYVFPPENDDEPYYFWPRFWLPDEDLHERGLIDGAAYEQWHNEGFLETIDGRVIRYEFVEKQILEDAERFRILEVAVDRFLAMQTAKRLEDEGLTCVGFGQGFLSMAPAFLEFERLIESKRLAHNGHPLLRWCVANCAAEQDAAGNRKPSKRHSSGRIDGVVAALMGLGRATASEGESTYDDGDSLVL